MNEEGPSTPATGLRLWLLVPLIVTLLLTALFATQLLSGRDRSELPSVLLDGPVPQFSLPRLDGLQRGDAPVPGLDSEDLRGGVFLVNIFASWCAPCRVEHPVLVDLARDERLTLVGINYKDKPDNARRFLNTLGNPYDRVGVDEKGRTAIEWGFFGIPETFLVDRDGMIRHKIVGPITAPRLAELKTAIDRLSPP